MSDTEDSIVREKAKDLIDFAFSGDKNASVACIPWSLIWDLRDAIEENRVSW